jgi:hypothetical protein
MSRFYHVSDSSVCAAEIASQGDPMGPGARATASNDVPAAAPVAAPRENINLWNDRRDANMTGLRGRS